MKKIKIIELLNKISKGEEVPKKIKYQNEEYYRNFATNEQIYYYLNADNKNLVSEIEYSCELNYEVEIIEDEVKIIEDEQLKESDVYTTITNSCWSTEQSNDLISNFCNHEIAINKLIREVNKLKSMN